MSSEVNARVLNCVARALVSLVAVLADSGQFWSSCDVDPLRVLIPRYKERGLEYWTSCCVVQSPNEDATTHHSSMD